MDIEFQAGDLVVDFTNGDVGLLLERFDVLENSTDEKIRGRIFAWDIVWTGPKIKHYNRYTPYTEVGLKKCIMDGILEHISGI